MTDTTKTLWSVDGQSLQTYAFNIETLGGDRMAPPALRGSDVVIPYAPGTTFTPKVPDSRVITLAMWVVGANEDGIVPSDEDSRRTFDRNWRMLRSLLFRYRKTFTLTKRFWVPTADLTAAGAAAQALETQGDWSLIEASAQASYASGLSPNMTGPARAVFTVDLRLSDPWFYSSEISTSFTANQTKTITVLGEERTHRIRAVFNGSTTNPRFTQTEEDGDPYVRYQASLTSGSKVTLDVQAFEAARLVSGVTTYDDAKVEHAGSNFWFFLDPGSTVVAHAADSGAGTASLVYSPAWI